jgi:Sec-independent protein translocase protein TatA
MGGFFSKVLRFKLLVMLGIGFAEILIIALVAFIALGPQQLPALMKKLAALYRQWAGLKDEFRFQIMNADMEPTDNNKDNADKKPDKQNALADIAHELNNISREKDGR